jgi:dTDP-4-amino-4,6-dideoxygalactose transaminase
MTSAAGSVKFVDLQAQIASLEPALTEAIQGVLRRGDFILGEAVAAFEAEWAQYCGVKHAVGVDSGLSALELALRAAEVGEGDEVITQANTFIATAGAIMAVGARPVLVDCDHDGQLDVRAVERAITRRTKAVMPVHLYGKIGDIDGVCRLATQAGIPVIEDACQAHGAIYRGRRAGSFGLAAAFSFYPAKNLGCFGDGGILVTNDDTVAAAVRTLRNYGSKAKYEHIALPLNHRLDTIQAAVLRVKLPHLDGWNARRQYLADAYREHLGDGAVGLPAVAEEGRHIYHLFVVQATQRDRLREALAAQGIETGIHYPIPLHAQPVLKGLGYRLGEFPNAERLAAHSLSLPMYPEMPLSHVERVAAALKSPSTQSRAA